MASQISDVKAIIKRAAEEAGFDLAGIAPATDAAELKHFPEWIAAGHAGEMKYLEARDDHGTLKRASLARRRALGTKHRRVRHQLQHKQSVLDAGS